MRRLVQWLSQADAEVLLSRRALLARAVLLVVPDVSGIKELALVRAKSAGAITSPPLPFGDMTATPYVSWSWVWDPTLGIYVLHNENRLGVGTDGHTTLTTYRDLDLGSTSACAFSFRAKSKDQFYPTTWNLIWQLQEFDSPTEAISFDTSIAKRSFMKARDGNDNGLNYPMLALQYDRWLYVVTNTRLAQKPNGLAEAWMAYDAWPDVSKPAMAHRAGQSTWQNAKGHDTLGFYVPHTAGSTKRYAGDFGHFARAATPARAIELAR